jgi:hypothetical protein
MRDNIKIKGMVTVRVLDMNGNVKLRKQGWFRRLLKLPEQIMEFRHHNIVTREGDALIADALMPTQAKTKVNGTDGYIDVGTGWTGNSTKSNTKVNTATGSAKKLDSGYPVLKAAWGSTGDTTITYRATFAAGNLNANGINEAALLNGSGSTANCLAYAQITPAVNVTSNDTLQVLWEITILGQ